MPRHLAPRDPGVRRAGRSVHHGRRRGRYPALRRFALGLSAFVSVTVLAVCAVGWAAYDRFDDAVNRRDGWVPEGDRPEEVPGELNILLLGSDSREGTNGEFGDPEGVRSDTTIIAHFDADGSLTVVSFPRDLLVAVDPPAPGVPSDGRTKLTNVMSFAGVSGLVSTLETFTGIKIDHTVSINLAGLRAMTDAVGGVTVCVRPLPDGSTRNLHDSKSGWNGQLGDNVLDGNAALAFVRTRYALDGDERLRIQRQHQFLSRLLDAATSAGVLGNPTRAFALLDAVGGALEVDENFGQSEMVELAKRLSDVDRSRIQFVTVPTYVPLADEGAVDDKGDIPPHGQVLFHDPAALEQIVAPMRADPAPTAPTAPAAPTAPTAPIVSTSTGDGGSTEGPPLAPGQVVVDDVLNGSGRNGLAGQAADDLAALGFAGDLTAGNADTRRAATEIRHAPGSAGKASATALAAYLPGAVLVDDTTVGPGLVLVLGSSFTHVLDAPATGRAPATAGSGNPGASAGGTVSPGAAGSLPTQPAVVGSDTSCSA